MRFVGRARELALLLEVWERVRAERRCELVTIVGDAGVGKSRLVAEALASSGARVVRSRCLAYGEGITYLPVVDVLKQLDLLPRDKAAATAIRSLLGETETVTSPAAIAWAFRKTLEQATGRGPLIVVFDDIHWGEETFLELLEHAALLSSGAAVLLLCMARPELLERRPSWPGTLRLEPLGDAAVEELIPPRITDQLRKKIARAAAGNPLFIEEMLAIANESEGEAAVPPTLRALLAARLDQLHPAERSLLQRGSVEGELFHSAAVEALAREPAPVERELAALVRKNLLRPDRPQLQIGEAYRFRHLLIRDAAYDTLPKAARAELHERYADWLAQHDTDLVERDELHGYHLEQAYRYRAELGQVDDRSDALAARAGRRLGSASRRALDLGDVRAATNLLGRAIALLPTDSLERLELMHRYYYAATGSGQIAEASAINQELYERATAMGERRLAALARGQLLMSELMHNRAADLDDVRAIAEELIETFADLGDELGLARAKWGLAVICNFQGRQGEAAEWLERALEHANASGDQHTRLSVTQTLALTLCAGPTPVEDSIRRCEELREANREDRVLEAVIARCLSALLAMAGRFDEAGEYGRRSSGVLDEANITISSWATRDRAAQAKEFAGDRAGAERDLEARWRFFRETFAGMAHLFAVRSAYELADLYCDDGRWDEAEECLAFYRDNPVVHNAGIDPLRHGMEARVAAHRGRHAEAVRLAHRAVELAEPTGDLNARARVWLALAEVQRARGETAEADRAVAAALDLYERKGNIAAAGRLRAAMPELQTTRS
jgi:predicted ATPase